MITDTMADRLASVFCPNGSVSVIMFQGIAEYKEYLFGCAAEISAPPAAAAVRVQPGQAVGDVEMQDGDEEEEEEEPAELFAEAEEGGGETPGAGDGDEVENEADGLPGANVLEECHRDGFRLVWGPGSRQYAIAQRTAESLRLPPPPPETVWSLEYAPDEEDPTRERAYVGVVDLEGNTYTEDDAPDSFFLGDRMKYFSAWQAGTNQRPP
jgi:hypothetical protein